MEFDFGIWRGQCGCGHRVVWILRQCVVPRFGIILPEALLHPPEAGTSGLINLPARPYLSCDDAVVIIGD